MWQQTFFSVLKCLKNGHFSNVSDWEIIQDKLSINFNDKCLVYLLSCKVCGLQYVGSTTNKCRFRRNNFIEIHLKEKKREEHMQPVIFVNFSSNDHNDFLKILVLLLLIKQMRLIPLEERNNEDCCCLQN